MLNQWALFLVLTVFIETVTVLCRFGFGLRSKVLQKQWPIRIHHGYIGLLVLIAGMIAPNNLIFALGGALVASDLAHHLIVLPLLTGTMN